jgi:alanyl-tRNA synthetase
LRNLKAGQRLTINGITVISTRVDDDLDRKDLRALADNLKEKISSCIVVLASVKDGEASLISMVTKDLTPKFSAGAILKEITSIAGGRGGGKADMAEGGIKEIDKLDKALEEVHEIVKSQH